MKVMGVAAAAAVLFAGAASAQSAKFAAVYDLDQVDIGAVVANVVNGSAGPNYISEVDLATIKVPSQKELLITVSGVVNLVTITEAKGKNGGGTSTSIAEAGVGLAVAVVPTGMENACLLDEESAYWAIPGEITLASRAQRLSVTTDLNIVDLVECDEDPNTDLPNCLADELGIDGSVSVALGLDTTAAHSFQFLSIDKDAGEYDVVACYDLDAYAQILNGYDVTVDGADPTGNVADAFVALGKRVMTVQEVRAVKDSIVADVD